MKILVLDNYDSFTYNLVHMLREMNQVPDVCRNDKIDLEAVKKYDKILLSPGPGLPADAGIMPALLAEYSISKSILGVCLGHQAIGENAGASLFNLPVVFHGMVTPIEVSHQDALFAGLPKKFNVCRYHSWVINEKEFPDTLEISSRDEQGTIMSIRHKYHDVRGVQFHPESVMSDYGMKMIQNWLKG